MTTDPDKTPTAPPEAPATIAAKHYVWGAVACATLIAVVLLAIFADGAHVTEILAFVAGLLIPGSPLGGIARRAAPVALGALALLALSGCTGGLLPTLRTIHVASSLAVEGAHNVAYEAGGEVASACEDDPTSEACEERGDAWKAADVAFDLAGAALVTFRGVIDSIAAGVEGDLRGAIGTAAIALVRAYARVRDAVCRLGAVPPAIPPIVLSFLRSLTGEEVEIQPSAVCGET